MPAEYAVYHLTDTVGDKKEGHNKACFGFGNVIIIYKRIYTGRKTVATEIRYGIDEQAKPDNPVLRIPRRGFTRTFQSLTPLLVYRLLACTYKVSRR